MKNISSIILVIFFFSCKEVRYGVSEIYSLKKEEKEIMIDEYILKRYAKLFNSGKTVNPLSKVVKGNDYFIYFSVLINNYRNDEIFKESKFLRKKIQNGYICNLVKSNASYFLSINYKSKVDRINYLVTLDADSSRVFTAFENFKTINSIIND